MASWWDEAMSDPIPCGADPIWQPHYFNGVLYGIEIERGVFSIATALQLGLIFISIDPRYRNDHPLL
jgi:hypothetical protein